MTSPRHSARPAHAPTRRHAAPRRALIVLVIVAVLAGLAAAAHRPGAAVPGGPPVSPAALVTSDRAESSAWYCVGMTTAAGMLAPGSIILTNTGYRAVSASISTGTDTNSTTSANLVVPARQQVVANLPQPLTGSWASDTVILSGGGVAVTQTVHGPNGWSETPCVSSTSQHWYFPSGTTLGTDALYIALFNPTSTPDVVDLSFVSPAGLLHPINYQGLVLQPGQTVVENISLYVQNTSRVSTTVMTRTGRVVASEMQVLSGQGTGLAVVTGSPRPEPQWTIPENLELQGGASSIDVYNPGSTTELVTVRTQLSSGSLSPFSAHVLPESTWVVPTSSETRIPDGDIYDAEVTSTGGSGVVVGRMVAAPATSPSPQIGLATAVDQLSASPGTHEWVVPSPGTAAAPAVVGVVPAHLSLVNTTGNLESYTVSVMTRHGARVIALGSLQPMSFISLSASTLFSAGLNSLLISASGPMAIAEDVGPTGTFGVVTMPGIPLS